MKYMSISDRIKEKYDKGQYDAAQGIYRPGNLYGVFLNAYKDGHSIGCRTERQVRLLTDFKTK